MGWTGEVLLLVMTVNQLTVRSVLLFNPEDEGVLTVKT
jgi:hypothetical protein